MSKTMVHETRNTIPVPVFLTEGFRFFFLMAGLFGFLSVAFWLVWLAVHAMDGVVPAPTIGIAPHYWHAHEMIYGYAVAVISGFFLTAVPNWTNSKPARALFVTSVGMVWLAGRLAVWFSASLPLELVALIDLAFLPPLAARIAWNLRRNPQPRNLVFIGLLAILFTGNLLMHLGWMDIVDYGAEQGARVGLLTVCGMIAIVGGRIVPAFTRNALRRIGIEEAARLPVTNEKLEKAGILTSILVPFLVLADLGDLAVGFAALAACLVNMVRFSRWCWRATLTDPILWSLHLGFFMLILGYASLAGALLLDWPNEVAALHMLGIGAVGGMTMAVMTRATLGHSGRPLKVSRLTACAYLMIAIAALIRGVLVDWFPGAYNEIMLVSGAIWLLGFALFLVRYGPLLTTPRPVTGST
ncbi:NnrS family protein [Coralliovum pocilloporae]|uniref:NnrS family protein n=1 Tax=Coralliovum pocilloporae TaxID=3066369 RepID=UPI003307A7DA